MKLIREDFTEADAIRLAKKREDTEKFFPKYRSDFIDKTRSENPELPERLIEVIILNRWYHQWEEIN